MISFSSQCGHKIFNNFIALSVMLSFVTVGSSFLYSLPMIVLDILGIFAVFKFAHSNLYYRPQRSCGQGNVFTGVCLSTGRGGCLPQCMLGCHTPPGPGRPPWDQGDPPGPGRPPWDQADPPGTRQTPPGPGRTPQDQADTPPEADSSIRSTSGRYASYWNAFLFIHVMCK